MSTSGNITIGSTVLSETDLAKIDNITNGTASSNKALVVNGSLDISGINSLTSTSITGTLQTAAQPNITSVSVLDITDHNGTTQGLRLGGDLLLATSAQLNDFVAGDFSPQFPVATIDSNLTLSGHNGTDTGLVLGSDLLTSTAIELNYLDGSTPGTATASNAVVLDANKDITGLRYLTASHLTGTLQTAAQPNITSVGELTSLSIAGDLTVGDTTISETEISYLDSVAPGTAAPLKTLVPDANNDLVGLNNLSALNLTGTLQTASQPNITSVSVLEITGHNGTDAGLSLNGTIITATATELNYVDVAKGSASADKALVLNNTKDISGINALSATSLTGTLQTASQPNITSVGTLSSITTSGDLTLGSTIISETDIGKIDQITNGSAAANKALVLNSDLDITGINKLSSASLLVAGASNSILPVEVGSVSYGFTGAYAYSNSDNAHGVMDANVSAPSSNFSARFDGRILVTGEVNITSDRRLKTNINDLDVEFAKKFILDTKPVKFNWKTEDEVTDYGYIAQDVMKLGYTDLVSIVQDPQMTQEVDDDGFISPEGAKYTLSPGKIVPILALSQKDLIVKVDDLQRYMSLLMSKICELENRIIGIPPTEENQ
jgi:hypothetical protein